METVKVPSPARSQGTGLRTPIRRKHRRTLSVGSAPSNASGRLTAIIQQNRNMESFVLSPLATRRSILSDNTEIEEPRRQSWWKKLGENSRDVTELFEENKIEEPNNIIEELDIEILSQENKNYTMDLPDSSDSESINSIVIHHKKLFTQKKNKPQKKFDEIIGTRESMAKINKTITNNDDKTINVATKELFQNKQRSKPIFPSALLNISLNKTAADKTKELTTVEPRAQVRNIFGNRAAKRKNIFTNFIVSESEDEIPEIEPKTFGFQKMLKSRRLSSSSSRAIREPSPASSIATDIEMDDWNMLPSSTMVEHQLEIMITGKSNKTLPSKVTEESAQLESTQEKSNQTSKTSKTKEDKIEINQQTDHLNDALNNSASKNKENKIEFDNNKLQQETFQNQCQDVQENYKNINQQVDNEENEIEISANKNQQVVDTEENVGEIKDNVNQLVDDNEEKEVETDNSIQKIYDNDEHKVDIDDDINHQVDDNEEQEVEIDDDENQKDVDGNQQVDDNEQNVVQMDEVINRQDDNDENEVEIDGDISLEKNAENELQNKSEVEKTQELVLENNDENELHSKSEVKETQEREHENNEENDIENKNFNFDLQSECEESDQDIGNVSENDEELLHQSLVQDQSGLENVSQELEDEVDNNENQEVEDESEVEPQNQSEVELNESQEQNESHEIESENESEEQNESQDVEEDVEDQNVSESEVGDQEVSEVIADSDNENGEPNDSQDEEDEANDSDNHDTDQIESGEDENQENNEVVETPNVSHDTTGRNRKKNESPEVILHGSNKQLDSFAVQGRNTSVRKTELIKSINIRPSLAPVRESIGFSDGTTNSSAEGSGWDSHRTTRKTLRQTFGRDFTPRKSLRALVMEKSAKRQTKNDIASVTAKFPQANSTELPEMSNRYDDDNPEGDENQDSNHEVSLRTRQTTLEMYLQDIKKKNTETRIKMEEAVRNSLNAPSKDHIFKVPAKPLFARRSKTTTKPKQTKPTLFLGELPAEVIEDMKYKPPKRFQPSNAPWITKRLYKFLETKLESKYDYKARIRAEKLVENIYHFAKDLRRHDVATTDAVDVLKREMARLDVVKTHFEFYEFFHQFMPREVRVKVVPDVVNKISLPKRGVFSDIL